MKKYVFILILFLGGYISANGGNFVAFGLTNPSETWSLFSTRAISVNLTNYGGILKVEIQGRYKFRPDYWGRLPSDQPYQLRFRFHLVPGGILTAAGIYKDNQWLMASSVDILTAESIYQTTPVSDAKLLVRRRLKRDYYGRTAFDYEMRLAPIDIHHEFVFKIEYMVPVTPSLWRMWTPLYLIDFLAFDSYNLLMSFSFIDLDRPESEPSFLYGVSHSEFMKQTSGEWRALVLGKYLNSQNFAIVWWRPFPSRYELRAYENEDGKFYHLMITPPLQPIDRKPKNVLIVYDLGDAIPYGYSRNQLLFEFKLMATSGLSDLDSINILLTDFVPRTLRDHFVPATNSMVETLFQEMEQAPQPHLSTLPQLLRTAKDFFNQENREGEIWIISTATKHSKPISVANEIIDLSLRRLHKPVTFKIFDCSIPDYQTYLYLNGVSYYGNQYLYQNLARLSQGGVVEASSTPSWALEATLADLFFPAVNAVEVDVLPTGGYHESSFLLHGARTHFPVSWPFIELSRYDGELPFAIDYFGKVDGEFFYKSVLISDTVHTHQPQLLATLWHAQHAENMLLQPQSYAIIEKIGRVATKYHFLSPYNGFILPGPSGLLGFKRLIVEEADTSQLEENPKPMPETFHLAAYPNPFNLSTTVYLEFREKNTASKAEIMIFNSLGQLIRTFTVPIAENQTSLRIQWNGTDDFREPAPSGLYLISARIGSMYRRVKVTLLK